MDKVSDLEFSTKREGYGFQKSENLVIEFMISDIRKIPEIRIRRFFDESSHFSCTISAKYTKIRWSLDRPAESSIAITFYQTSYITRIVEIVTRYHNKSSLYFSFEREYRSSSSIYFSLFYVVDLFSFIGFTEIASK